MTLPPGWPLGLPDDLAQRYESGARELYSTKLFRDPDRFDLALNLALDCCERARNYPWPEKAELKRLHKLIEEWPGAVSGARKLAAALEKVNGFPGIFLILDAAERTGLKLNSSKQPSLAIADFLRELAKEDLQLGHGAGVNNYGSISISRQKGERLSWPSRTVILTISLGHLFRLVAEHRPGKAMVISITQPISSIEGWNAAVAFARGAGVDGDQGDRNVRATGERWRSRHKGRLRYIGWKAHTDKRGGK